MSTHLFSQTMKLNEFIERWNDESEVVEVQTSGSTGTPKKMMVEKERMRASARITCQFLGLKEGDTALLCMPLDYIAGKMVVVRALVAHLQLIAVEPSSHPLKGLDSAPTFAAMVPMQVIKSLEEPEEAERLRQIKHLIIGGGAIDAALEERLRSFPNAVWSTYGMTETLSHIALRRISGSEASLWYTPLDSVSISTDADGCLIVDAPKVCSQRLTTNDIAIMDAEGRRFRIVGRRDNVICSGGIKIQMEEVERLLKPHINCQFVITKRHDPLLGEAVTLLYEGEASLKEKIEDACRGILPRHWHPRYIMSIDRIPMTETGKPARARIAQMVN